MGNVIDHTGYGCSMSALVHGWREVWAPAATGADERLFGITTLAAGGSEGAGQHMAGMRWSQTSNFGRWTDNPALPNTFGAQVYGKPAAPYSTRERTSMPISLLARTRNQSCRALAWLPWSCITFHHLCLTRQLLAEHHCTPTPVGLMVWRSVRSTDLGDPWSGLGDGNQRVMNKTACDAGTCAPALNDEGKEILGCCWFGKAWSNCTNSKVCADGYNCSLPEPESGQYGSTCLKWNASDLLSLMAPLETVVRSNDPSGTPGNNFMGGTAFAFVFTHACV
jgi:hypothetical protein